MANKTNQRSHRNNHRRSMQRSWHASKYQKNAQKHLMKPSSNDLLEGSRIINLDKLQEFIDQLTAHAAQYSSQIILSGEKKAGLASILSSQCSKCSFTIPLRKWLVLRVNCVGRPILQQFWVKCQLVEAIQNCMNQ